MTVTGHGGVGKTRLAAEVARQISGEFADGAWLAELAAVQVPGSVPEMVAAGLAIGQPTGLSVTESLARGLAGRHLLLVLDNCEHVGAAVAELCVSLLAAADIAAHTLLRVCLTHQ